MYSIPESNAPVPSDRFAGPPCGKMMQTLKPPPPVVATTRPLHNGQSSSITSFLPHVPGPQDRTNDYGPLSRARSICGCHDPPTRDHPHRDSHAHRNVADTGSCVTPVPPGLHTYTNTCLSLWAIWAQGSSPKRPCFATFAAICASRRHRRTRKRPALPVMGPTV